MKRFFLILIFLFSQTFFAVPQEYQQLNTRFLPPDYYVGDTVDMQFLLRTAADVDLQIPQSLPDPEWVEILSLKMEKSGGDTLVSLRFIPYFPGTRTLPPLDLGGLVLRDVKIYTSSVIAADSERTLSGLRPNLIIPGTRVTGAVIFSVLLSFPILFVMLFRLIRNQAGSLIKTYRINLPYRKFLRLLKKIKQSLNDMSDKEFFNIYAGGMKDYLSTRFHKDFSSLTTKEMELVFRGSSLTESVYLTLLNLFHRMDRVKFAGEEMSLREREGMIQEAEEISSELENWRKTHADL